MRAPDFLLSAFFSIHGAAGSPAHAPGLRRKCPPRSLRITSSSRLTISRGIYSVSAAQMDGRYSKMIRSRPIRSSSMPFFGTYSTSFREKYKNDADMYENEFTPKPYVRISSHRSVKRPQRGLRQWMPSASKLQRVKNRLNACGLFAKMKNAAPGTSNTSISAIFSETTLHSLYIQMFSAVNDPNISMTMPNM